MVWPGKAVRVQQWGITFLVVPFFVVFERVVAMTVAEMSVSEQNWADESPALIKFRQAVGGSRLLRTLATYVLRDEIADSPQQAHEEIYKRFAEAAGTSIDALRVDVSWARKILEDDLRGAFAAEDIPEVEWSERISLGHLRAIGRANHRNGDPLDSMERVTWLLSAYHANQSAGEFTDHLRMMGYLQPKRQKRFGAEDAAKEEEHVIKGREAAGYLQKCLAGDYGPYVQDKITKSWIRREAGLPTQLTKPTTADMLLIAMGEALRSQGVDVDLSALMKRRGDKPIKVMAFLEFLAGEFKREHPDAEFRLGDEPR
jgi:hypothetical protein